MFVKFLVSGTFNTSLSYAIYFICIIFGLHFTLSSFFALIFSLISGYLLGKIFVFRSRGRFRTAEIFRYLALWIIIYASNISIIGFLIWIDLPPELAGLLAIGGTVPISYFGQKLLVFRK